VSHDPQGRASPHQGAPQDFLRRPAYPWGDLRAVQLRDLLVGAYPDVELAAHIAAMSGIPTTSIAHHGSAEMVWNRILDRASAQGALGALITTVREDQAVVAYRPAIDLLLRGLGVRTDQGAP
jgi:hypothetical protein